MLTPFIKSLMILLLTVNNKNNLRKNNDIDFKSFKYIPSDMEHSYFISYVNDTKVEHINLLFTPEKK